MSEEIIIDGVNVAECIFSCKYNVGIACCCDNIRDDKIPFANFCEENKDCYYKQLKRLEQENKQMKSALEKIRYIVTSPYPGQPRDVLNIINEVLK